ncbi:acetyl-CoA carboxylase carboxyltransferase subunit alpha [Micromonospora sp. CPCC 205711]|uniref:acetyl-CoA carboxylase carboxyltransferase subunit alpha n=1 Tax=Micromonospora sp. CPCC 205547 TaxID=3122400 RepID=UPI002FEEB602
MTTVEPVTRPGWPSSPFGGGEDDWLRCAGCGELQYRLRWENNLRVCPDCQHHARLDLPTRLNMLLDPGSLAEFGTEVEPRDILGFVDAKPYPRRLAEARARTGRADAVVAGTARIEGLPLVVAALDFAFMGGSVGSVAGELIARAARRALADRVPLLLISTSGGARMQEGAVSLMQLAKTSQELRRLHDAGVLTVNLNTDPTYGGATASFSMLGDVIVAEPGARIGFAGPEVVRQTIRVELPAGFQSAEFLAEHGQVDLVVPRESLRATLARLVRLHAPAAPVTPAARSPHLLTEPARVPAVEPTALVTTARNLDRPTTLDYCRGAFDEFVELHGDRLGGGDDPALVGGLARIGDRTVVVLGHQKGHDTAELVRRNFGMPQPWGYHKAHRLMTHAARFGLPLVTLIDTPGAYPGIEAERRGQGYAIARSIEHMSGLPVPVVSVVTGEGGSGGALAIGVANRVLILENAYFSVISPEGCATILFKNAALAPRAAAQLGITPGDLLRLGVVDGVVAEPPGGAHADRPGTVQRVRSVLAATLDELVALSPEELIAQRYARFAAFGDAERQAVLTVGEKR